MILYPNVHLKSVLEITIEFLHKNQINALILDVDNTLIDYDKNLQLEIIEWAKNLKANNIKLYILSNTNKKGGKKQKNTYFQYGRTAGNGKRSKGSAG